MTKYLIVCWRDIPVHVRASQGRSRLSRPLSPRFQKSVHRAAFRAKAINGFEYINEWRTSEWQELDGELEDVLTEVISELELSYSNERLENLALNKGFEIDGN